MNTSFWTTAVVILLGGLMVCGCATQHASRTHARVPSTQPVELAPGATKTIKTRMGSYPVPTLTPYLPDPSVANGTAVIVCPGGGYGALMDTYEGQDVCRWWNAHGVTAFFLRYRIAPDRYPAALHDAQRAIRTVRDRAGDYGVDPHRVGIMGFSAGGHLAACTATLFHGASDRPDFAILAYPVITLVPPYAHGGSRDNLLGPSPRPGLAQELSLETRVTDQTPPCFLVQGRNDKIVDYHNSQIFYDALRSHGVPARLVLLANGPHGFGLRTPAPADAPWPDECLSFLQSIHVLPAGRP